VPPPGKPLRILFSVPAYWPAVAFGGPVWVTRDLGEGLAARGHQVEVVTTSLLDLEHGRSLRTSTAEIGGVRVHYLATPLRYRWMGLPLSLPLVLRSLGRPDVVHVCGYRDPLGTAVSAWCRAKKIPYLLEPMGMFRPRVRKQRLKGVLDPILPKRLARAASLVVATSELERDDLVEGGLDRDRIAVRANPFPPLRPGRSGALRKRLGLTDEPLVLYVGRIAGGKGIELLVEAMRGLPEAHLALIGPQGHAAVADHVAEQAVTEALRGRIHLLPPTTDERPLDVYGDGDVLVLASTGKNENFGVVAAEAIAAGTPVVVSDQTGIAALVDGRAGIVVPPSVEAVREAIARILGDAELRERLRRGAAAVAEEYSAAAIVEQQEALYRAVAAR
jgi:glycosyltransferase involved in cell wall biosynthesis